MTQNADKKREQERLSLATKKKELDGAANDRNALLAKVRKNKSLFMAEQKELMKASAELQSTIKRLLAEKIALNKPHLAVNLKGWFNRARYVSAEIFKNDFVVV